MSIRTKGRRRITVKDILYIWYIAPDDDSPCDLLNIASDDKYLILSCPLGTDTPYVISKGRSFQSQKTNGCWNRYPLPFDLPEIITPKFVEKLILWATQKQGEQSVCNNQKRNC